MEMSGFRDDCFTLVDGTDKMDSESALPRFSDDFNLMI